MSARTGKSSKANSFHSIFGISSGPEDFLTFKTRRALRHAVAQAEVQIPKREALRDESELLLLPRNSLNFNAIVVIKINHIKYQFLMKGVEPDDFLEENHSKRICNKEF